MKILFITAPLYDYLADSLLVGFRDVYGADCVDWPRKPIMYGDFPSVYGRGFTVWSKPIPDVPAAARALKEDVDLVIYSSYRRQVPIDWRVLVRNRDKAPRVVYLDGYDDVFIDPERRPYFKRELTELAPGVLPTGFCVPDRLVRPLDVAGKTQLHQTHVQDTEFTSETGYKFTEEKDYYDDLARSYFGITMRKGGWDCTRHYEIMAAGALVMFKHYDQKPAACAPQCPHFISYTDKADFMAKTNRLVVDGKPTEEYNRILQAQRDGHGAGETTSGADRGLFQGQTGGTDAAAAFQMAAPAADPRLFVQGKFHDAVDYVCEAEQAGGLVLLPRGAEGAVSGPVRLPGAAEGEGGMTGRTFLPCFYPALTPS